MEILCIVKNSTVAVAEFSLNDFTNSVTKIFAITVKGFKPATSCVRDQDVPQRQQDSM